MSMRRSNIPPSPSHQSPNRWRLAVFSLGLPEFTQSVQELVTQHLQRHANRASTWRDQNGMVVVTAPLEVGSVWELPGLSIDVVRGAQEKDWGRTVFRALTRPLMGLEGWAPHHAVLMAAWGAESVEVNLTRVTPKAQLLIPHLDPSSPRGFSAFSDRGFGFEEGLRTAFGRGAEDPEEIVRLVLSEEALPEFVKMPGWEEAKQAALERRLPQERIPRPKPRF